LDEAVITARSGDGGKGCVSFRREKYIPKGGPDGGDGGRGGSIIVQASRRIHNLNDYGARTHFRAPDGESGKGKNRSGKNGADLILKVPLGTIVQDSETDEILADLIQDNQEVHLIPGGRGGKGNQHFATPTHRAPGFAQAGRPGRQKTLRFSLKYLADVGLIGLPNVGKSTLLSKLSRARPKVNSYPFTTLDPHLGVMLLGEERSVVIADIPGLIEGASRGKGLGHRFLKHVERTRLLLHLLDITYSSGREILEDFHILMNELAAFDPRLLRKPQVVLINKMDLRGAAQRDPDKVREALSREGIEALPISALTGEGLDALKEVMERQWKQIEEKS
jgi:GTP-binding protein